MIANQDVNRASWRRATWSSYGVLPVARRTCNCYVVGSIAYLVIEINITYSPSEA